MNMKIARTGFCVVVMGGALGVAGLAQAGTVEPSKAEAPATASQQKVLDDAQMAQVSAGATSWQSATSAQNQANQATANEIAKLLKSRCTTANRCAR